MGHEDIVNPPLGTSIAASLRPMPMGSLELVLVGLIAGVALGLFAEWVRRRVGIVPSNAIALLTIVAVAIAVVRDNSGEMAPVLGLLMSGYAAISWHGRRPRPGEDR